MSKVRQYIDKEYQAGKMLRWMIEDTQGNSVYCHKCGNIANGVMRVKRNHVFNIPLCKQHLVELFPKKDIAMPCIIPYSIRTKQRVIKTVKK